MASTLRDNLNKILQEKEQKIKPENIKQGVTILGVEGNVEVLDTSDANAVVSDLAEGKTAYVKGTKITGTLPSVSGTYYVTIEPTLTLNDSEKNINVNGMIVSDRIMKNASRVSIPAKYDRIGELIGLKADEIKRGVKYLNVEGTFESLDTSDANASAEDLMKDKTAYVNGEKITGTLDVITDEIKIEASSVSIPLDNDGIVTMAGTIDKTGILTSNLPVHINAAGEQVAAAIGLTPEFIKAGTTIMGIEGTYGADESTKNAVLRSPEGSTIGSLSAMVVSIENIDTSSFTTVANMFNGATQLKSLPEMNLSQVTNSYAMCRDCTNLVSTQQFNFTKSQNLMYTFTNCSNLQRINMIPPAVEMNLVNCFAGCTNLLELPPFDYYWLKRSSYTYGGSLNDYCHNCSSLTQVSLGKKSAYARYGHSFVNAFRNCTNLLTFTGMSTSAIQDGYITYCNSMFENCYRLQTVDYWRIYSPAVNNIFRNCYNLLGFTDSSISRGPGVGCDRAFCNCYNLLNLPAFGSMNFYASTDSVFENCYNLKINNVIGCVFYNTSTYSYSNNVFKDCHNLTNVHLRLQYQTNRFCECKYWFMNCHNLTDVTLEGFGGYLSLGECFIGCENFKHLNLINTATSIGNLFRNSLITEVANSILNNGEPFESRYIYANQYRDCMRLTTSGLINLDAYNGDNAFTNCYNLTNLTDTVIYNGWNVMNMFANCNKLSVLNCFANWTANTQMRISNIVFGCTNLHTMGEINMSTHNGTSYYICPFGYYAAILNNTAPVLHNLVNFGGFGGLGSAYVLTSANNAYAAVDIVAAPNLSYQSLLNITTNLANLYTVYNVAEGGTLSYPQLIRMENNQYAKLTEDDINAVQSKGWNIEVHTIGGEANG